VLIVLGAASGLLLGGQLACFWGVRKADRVGPELLQVALLLLPMAYFWSASLWGWPTPGSIARDAGLLTGPTARALSVGITIGTAVVVAAVLVRSGATRRLERWSSTSE
jgi:hypothetical protein